MQKFSPSLASATLLDSETSACSLMVFLKSSTGCTTFLRYWFSQGLGFSSNFFCCIGFVLFWEPPAVFRFVALLSAAAMTQNGLYLNNFHCVSFIENPEEQWYCKSINCLAVATIVISWWEGCPEAELGMSKYKPSHPVLHWTICLQNHLSICQSYV